MWIKNDRKGMGKRIRKGTCPPLSISFPFPSITSYKGSAILRNPFRVKLPSASNPSQRGRLKRTPPLPSSPRAASRSKVRPSLLKPPTYRDRPRSSSEASRAVRPGGSRYYWGRGPRKKVRLLKGHRNGHHPVLGSCSAYVETNPN